LLLLVSLLGGLAATPAAASPPTKAQQAAIAALPETYRAWIEEVEIILTDEERTIFLSLAKDYQRDAFIERFWAVRDTVKRTARNEFRDAWEASLAQAKAMFGGIKDGRTRAILLNGIPDERVESDCSLILVPTEVWFYAPSQHFREGHVVVLYRKWSAGPFRLWEPADGIDVLFTGESGPLGAQHSLGEIASPGNNGCGEDGHARRIFDGIAWVLSQAADWLHILTLIDQPPKPPGAEWVSAFNSYSTDIPAGAAPLAAKLDLAFPGRMQNRTVVQGLVTVPPGAAGQARLGEARSYNLLLNGEVLAGGELLDSFRYKFDLPAPETAPEAIPLAFERPLRPGDYTLIVKLEDVNSGKVYREERPLSVPLMATAAPVTTAPRTPEEAESARVLAEANAALRSGETTIKLVPPLGELRAGMQRFDTLTTGPGIDKVTFVLDGKAVLTKRSLPFSVELDLGNVPRTRSLAVAAYDAEGNTLAGDEIQINATGNRFRVHLVEPQKGKRYASSLLAHAEVEVPEEETLERVEIYLDEAKVATLFQPPWVYPIVLPKGEGLAYVRAVAYLADGSSAEAIVFVNAPEEMAQINVDFVELYATVLDRKGHPVTPLVADTLNARDFSVSEDGARQQIARCEPVTDLPIHAAVAIDISASMAPNLEKAQAAALQFLQGMVRPKDRAEVITFNDHPAQVVKFTRDLKTLAGGLSGLKAERGTSLYDSLIFSFYTFNGLKGRRALLLLSDGRDEGSRFGFEEALDFARRAGVTVYAIGLGDEVDRKKLSRIAEETGGRAFFPRKPEELAAIYAGIEAELRSQVLIAYQSTSTRNDPGFRVVDLKVNRPGLEAKTIRGYYP
jgi:VWFA-related protein